MHIKCNELFPTKLTLIIFVCYISLFVGQGVFVTASQDENNAYNYNTVAVVLFTEVLKLIISTTLYCRDNNINALFHDVRKHSKVMLLYFVPAVLYCLYNNLAFVNLATFDPTTYYLLLQLRVVLTGILFQIIFKKYLTMRQWLSLILLTIGCMIKQLNWNSDHLLEHDAATHIGSAVDNVAASSLKSNRSSLVGRKNTEGFDLSISAVFILAQTVCSCLAGVFNEFLLKGKGRDVNIFIQNVFMYIDSIACNCGVLLFRNELLAAFSVDSLKSIFRPRVLIIVANNAAIGITTSFFLKYLNSILKTFASSLELVFTAIISYILFAIPIYLNTAIAIAVVSFSIYLYSQSPVVNSIRTHIESTTLHDAGQRGSGNDNAGDNSSQVELV